MKVCISEPRPQIPRFGSLKPGDVFQTRVKPSANDYDCYMVTERVTNSSGSIVLFNAVSLLTGKPNIFSSEDPVYRIEGRFEGTVKE